MNSYKTTLIHELLAKTRNALEIWHYDYYRDILLYLSVFFLVILVLTKIVCIECLVRRQPAVLRSAAYLPFQELC